LGVFTPCRPLPCGDPLSHSWPQRVPVACLQLHFGNVDFIDDGSSADGCVVKPECVATLALVRGLLGLDEEQFDKVLRFRRLVVGTEVTMRRLKAEEVCVAKRWERGGGGRGRICAYA
jgi:hypothetical protein